jgi:DNA-binding NarL/FixJ family response regulator
MVVCHRCDNPPCCNPRHLFLGTTAANVADRDAKQRQARGERIALARLTEESVREIRRLQARGFLHREIARQFNVSRPTISAVCSGRTWRHVA